MSAPPSTSPTSTSPPQPPNLKPRAAPFSDKFSRSEAAAAAISSSSSSSSSSLLHHSPPSPAPTRRRRRHFPPAPRQQVIIRLPRSKHLYRSSSHLSTTSDTYAPFHTIVEPSVEPSGLRPLSLPHPNRSPRRQLVVALRPSKHVVTQASTTNDPSQHDGFFHFRFHSSRLQKVPLNYLSSSSSTTMARRKATNHLHTRNFPHVQLAPGANSARTMLLNDPIATGLRQSISPSHHSSSYKIRYDCSARVEVKRSGKIDSYHASFDDSQYGSARIVYTPAKKVSCSFSVRRPVSNNQEHDHHHSSTTATTATFTDSRHIEQGSTRKDKTVTSENTTTSRSSSTSSGRALLTLTDHADSITDASPLPHDYGIDASSRNPLVPILHWLRRVVDIPAAAVLRRQRRHSAQLSRRSQTGGRHDDDVDHVTSTKPISTPLVTTSATSEPKKNPKRTRRSSKKSLSRSSGGGGGGRKSGEHKSKSSSHVLPHTWATKLDAEYQWKGKRCTFVTGIDNGEGRELSLRFMNKPKRLIPRVRTSIPCWLWRRQEKNIVNSSDSTRSRSKKGVSTTTTTTTTSLPWVCWMPEFGHAWHAGQTQIGWKDFTFTKAWQQQIFTVAQRKKDGSSFGASLGCKDRSGKLEKTIVTKAFKGKIGMTINGMMGNQKDQTGITVSLHDGKSTLSAYARTSRSFGLSTDSNFYIGHKFCRVALRTDDLKSLSVRLGLFY